MIYKSNLLSHRWQRRMLIVRSIRFWCVAWTLAGLVAVLACTGKYSLHSHQATRVDELNAKALPLYKIASETTEYKRKLAKLEGRESLLATLDSSNQPFQLMGVVSQSAALATGKLYIESFDLQTVRKSTQSSSGNANPLLRRKKRSRSTSTQNKSQPEVEQVELTLRGVSADDIAIAKFVAQLREYEIFDSVVLHSSHAETNNGKKQFHVGCKYSK